MANGEQLKILQKGVATWNTWRKVHPDTKIDFSSVNLSGADFSGADFSGADLLNTKLRETNLSNADFFNADLSNADLFNADLFRANLTSTNLSKANLYNVDLREADLFDANLNEANLSYTQLDYATIRGTVLSNTDLNNATVKWTVFGNLDLSTVKGLETIKHEGPSIIGTDTLLHSRGNISEIFLRKAGLDENFIEYTHALTNKPIEYYTCFISYSSQDERFARRLHNDLQQEGVRCWFAPEDMDIGDKIRHRIDESIRLYDKLLLILSEHSIASTWVEYEVDRALNKEPQGVPNVLYPVRVDQAIMTCSAAWARDIKSTRHIGDFENWTNPPQYEENFKRLLRALNTKKDQQKN